MIIIIIKDKVENRIYAVNKYDKKHGLLQLLEIGGEGEERYIFNHELMDNNNFIVKKYKEYILKKEVQ